MGSNIYNVLYEGNTRVGGEKGKFIPYKNDSPLPGRNKLCFCGSGKKFKNCHWKPISEKYAVNRDENLYDNTTYELAELYNKTVNRLKNRQGPFKDAEEVLNVETPINP